MHVKKYKRAKIRGSEESKKSRNNAWCNASIRFERKW
jgi:hypothetical protein